MTDTITLTGLVATQPRHLVTSEGLPITSFRLASPQRRFDRSQDRWTDADTNWYTVTGFRQLAINIAGSLSKGDRVVVTGRLRMRDWTAGDKAGTNIEVDADSIGHDLSWGTAIFTRSISTASAAAQAGEAAHDGEQQPGEAEASLPAADRAEPGGLAEVGASAEPGGFADVEAADEVSAPF